MAILHQISERRKKVDLMGQVVLNDEGEPVFSFGKHKGRPVEEVFKSEPGYFGWLMQADFPLYTKKVFRDIKEGMA
jgi:DNA polymerase-3 subunit epsilon